MSTSAPCKGCLHDGTGTNMQCGIYGIPPSYFERMGLCPFNPPKVEIKKAFARVGQQKGKRGKKGR